MGLCLLVLNQSSDADKELIHQPMTPELRQKVHLYEEALAAFHGKNLSMAEQLVGAVLMQALRALFSQCLSQVSDDKAALELLDRVRTAQRFPDKWTPVQLSALNIVRISKASVEVLEMTEK